jgi:hypothetical protein
MVVRLIVPTRLGHLRDSLIYYFLSGNEKKMVSSTSLTTAREKHGGSLDRRVFHNGGSLPHRNKCLSTFESKGRELEAQYSFYTVN